ncbi:sugar transferase [Plantactinospora sp. CA-294935]|uniref:sugar transferase n=1 Tax=Plantactinospora sp. CA-294935 TaxID=3240012 RepID=UPI003D93BCF7
MTSWPAVQPGAAMESALSHDVGRLAPPTVEQSRPVDESDQRVLPRPRAAEQAVTERAGPGLDTTAVLPYAGSATSKRTRSLRAWMVTAPVDLVALLTPLLLTDRYWRGTLFTAALTVTIFAAGGLYRGRRHVSILDELPTLCGRLLASAGTVAIIAATRHGSVEYVAGFMRGVALSAGLVLVGRTITRRAVVLARQRRWVEHNAIIIGSGPISLELARLLRRNPRYGLRFAGCVDSTHRHLPGAAPLIGTLEDLEQRIALTECDVLIIADPECPEPALMELLSRPASARCDLWAVQRLWGSRSPGGMPDHIGAIPVVQIRYTTLSGPRWAVKRASDLVLASVALVLLSPVILLCAMLTFLDGGRGIFFRQERIGQYGKPFKVIKFRTMRPRDEHESQTNWSIADDRRVGPIGRFMRRTSLDELPQLWNILRGDMTVVGPRPERPYFVEKFSAEHPDYAMRHRVPVGLTGLAQVSGLRGDTPISDRARFDNYYIENWSLWLDTKVLVRTIAEVFRGGGR